LSTTIATKIKTKMGNDDDRDKDGLPNPQVLVITAGAAKRDRSR